MSNKAETLSTAQVAERLHVTPRTLYRWLYDHAIREPRSSVISGKRFRFWTPADVKRVQKFMSRKRTRSYGAMRRVLKGWPVTERQSESRPQPPSPMAVETSTFQAIAPAAPQAIYRGATFVNLFDPSDEVLTLNELAERLKVRPSTIYELTRKRGRIRADAEQREPLPSRKIGKALRFSWQEVVGWLNQQKAAQQQKG